MWIKTESFGIINLDKAYSLVTEKVSRDPDEPRYRLVARHSGWGRHSSDEICRGTSATCCEVRDALAAALGAKYYKDVGNIHHTEDVDERVVDHIAKRGWKISDVEHQIVENLNKSGVSQRLIAEGLGIGRDKVRRYNNAPYGE